MKTDIVRAAAMPEFVLSVDLADGRAGTFDLKPHLSQPGLKALRDPAYFAQVQVLLGAPTWPEGEDIAPETVASELKLFQAA